MNETTGVAYLSPWQPNHVIFGLGAGKIIESNSAKFKIGKLFIIGRILLSYTNESLILCDLIKVCFKIQGTLHKS
jgi:Putative NADP-dependent oxidoreductases